MPFFRQPKKPEYITNASAAVCLGFLILFRGAFIAGYLLDMTGYFISCPGYKLDFTGYFISCTGY